MRRTIRSGACNCRRITVGSLPHRLRALKPSHSSGGLVGGHQQRSAFVLHEEHDEFRRFGFACVPPNHVNIIGAFIEGLTRCQSHFFSGSVLPGGYSTVIIRPSLPGRFVRSFERSSVTLASCATSVPDMRHASAKISFVNVIN